MAVEYKQWKADERAEGSDLGQVVRLTDLVVPPGAGRLMGRLLSRLDQVEESALHACLAKNGLDLEHFECASRGVVAGLMTQCAAVAQKT